MKDQFKTNILFKSTSERLETCVWTLLQNLSTSFLQHNCLSFLLMNLFELPDEQLVCVSERSEQVLIFLHYEYLLYFLTIETPLLSDEIFLEKSDQREYAQNVYHPYFSDKP